jgi:hypothetical protein
MRVLVLFRVMPASAQLGAALIRCVVFCGLILDRDGNVEEIKILAEETVDKLKSLPSHGNYIPKHAYRYFKGGFNYASLWCLNDLLMCMVQGQYFIVWR